VRCLPPGAAGVPRALELRVLCAGESGDRVVATTVGDLLPASFGPERLSPRQGEGDAP